jgi:hypothetical protein
MAAIAGGERTTWHHNLIAHCRSRNPRFAGLATCDFRNNVVYNWGEVSAYGDFERVNFIGNWFQGGPSTKGRHLFYSDPSVLPKNSFFAQGNFMDGKAGDDWQAIEADPRAKADQPFPAPKVRMEDAATAFGGVLANVGATLPQRDATDARIIAEVRSGTGSIIDRAPD